MKEKCGADPGAGPYQTPYIYIYIYTAQMPAQTKKEVKKTCSMISIKNSKTIIEQMKNSTKLESRLRRRPPGADLQKCAH